MQHLNTVKQVCHTLGVPLALEKVEGPATVLPFLGILLDTQQMEARLPHKKFIRLKSPTQKIYTSEVNHHRMGRQEEYNKKRDLIISGPTTTCL